MEKDYYSSQIETLGGMNKCKIGEGVNSGYGWLQKMSSDHWLSLLSYIIITFFFILVIIVLCGCAAEPTAGPHPADLGLCRSTRVLRDAQGLPGALCPLPRRLWPAAPASGRRHTTPLALRYPGRKVGWVWGVEGSRREGGQEELEFAIRYTWFPVAIWMVVSKNQSNALVWFALNLTSTSVNCFSSQSEDGAWDSVSDGSPI